MKKLRLISICVAIATVASLLVGCADPSSGGTSDTLKPGSGGNIQQTDNTNSAATEPQETEAPIVETQGTINFVIGDDGKIVGSPSDYNIYFDINGLKFTAAEFENDMEKYASELYDMLADSAPYKWDRISSSGKAHTILQYSINYGPANFVDLCVSATNGGTIRYGTEGSHPSNPHTDTSVVDFKMNDIKVGDSIEKVIECYGEPTTHNATNCYDHWNGPDVEPDNDCTGDYFHYQFEDGSVIFVMVLGQEIAEMRLEYWEQNVETAE